MQINPRTGLLNTATFIPSPNHDERPAQTAIDLLVIHGISLPPGKFGGEFISKFFCNELDANAHPYFQEIAQMKVSSHVLILRSGEIIQFVPFHKRAWHAGESCHDGRNGCNDFSIGIELEGTDETPYEKIQYLQLIQISQQIMLTYPEITRHRIVGHSDIAPFRKTDPGAVFEWNFFRESLEKGKQL